MTSISRRRFLATGAAASASLALPAFLLRAKANNPVSKNLIVVFQVGGWDGTFLDTNGFGSQYVDMLPGEPQTFGGIVINGHERRPSQSAFFQKYASKTAVVLGINVRSIAHDGCWKRMLTGTADEFNPDLGAIAAHELGEDLSIPYLVLGPVTYPGEYSSLTAGVGARAQISALLDPAEAYPAPEGAVGRTGMPAIDKNDDELVNTYLRARVDQMKGAMQNGVATDAQTQLDAFVRARARSSTLRNQPALVQSFGKRGQFMTLAQQNQLAVSVLKSGTSRAVMMQTQGWDTHTNNDNQNPMLDQLFSGLVSLADSLAATPGKESGKTLLDETVVVVASEMVRTPKLNASVCEALPCPGKDHWPLTSGFVFGGGIQGGRVIGGTTNRQLARAIDLGTGKPSEQGDSLASSSLIAGVLKHIDIDPAKYFDTPPLTL